MKYKFLTLKKLIENRKMQYSAMRNILTILMESYGTFVRDEGGSFRFLDTMKEREFGEAASELANAIAAMDEHVNRWNELEKQRILKLKKIEDFGFLGFQK